MIPVPALLSQNSLSLVALEYRIKSRDFSRYSNITYHALDPDTLGS
jgi:hypothetical protein